MVAVICVASYGFTYKHKNSSTWKILTPSPPSLPPSTPPPPSPCRALHCCMCVDAIASYLPLPSLHPPADHCIAACVYMSHPPTSLHPLSILLQTTALSHVCRCHTHLLPSTLSPPSRTHLPPRYFLTSTFLPCENWEKITCA